MTLSEGYLIQKEKGDSISARNVLYCIYAVTNTEQTDGDTNYGVLFRMGLFKPAWQSKNFDKAANAVDAITDERKLVGILNTFSWNDNTYAIKERALSRITNQNLLLELLKRYSKTDVDITRKFASICISKINDQQLLKSIVLSFNYSMRNREEALGRITDQSIVDSILNTKNNFSNIKKAFKLAAEGELRHAEMRKIYPTEEAAQRAYVDSKIENERTSYYHYEKNDE